ncbi:hypothetical protein [Adhaeretor mobilis]|uniref:Uncharacterized protein n=1 Tax=Adhaeretor mobilis TaxID=1930276 RepID=A0A517MVZ8_9BACT|nr:hypothetical protein [Adhaeretor mobilis]QDS99060.1 hypothetical protein HG15A2_23500 [Adhaeretor mobilis]
MLAARRNDEQIESPTIPLAGEFLNWGVFPYREAHRWLTTESNG